MPLRRRKGAARRRALSRMRRLQIVVMLRKRSRTGLSFLLIASALLAGCSGGPSPLTLPPPEPPGSGTSALQTILTPAGLVVGTSTEVYTRIARGALTCWFGASGPLKSRYIYHAEAQPASKGGNSEIKIMTRDADAEDPRALRAYRVLIMPSAGTTRLEIENVRIEEPLATRMKQDVERWARDEEGCGESPVTAGWTAADEPEPASKHKKNNNKKP